MGVSTRLDWSWNSNRLCVVWLGSDLQAERVLSAAERASEMPGQADPLLPCDIMTSSDVVVRGFDGGWCFLIEFLVSRPGFLNSGTTDSWGQKTLHWVGALWWPRGAGLVAGGGGLWCEGGSRRGVIRIHTADSRCFTAETSTTLESNRPPRNNETFWEGRCSHVHWGCVAVRPWPVSTSSQEHPVSQDVTNKTVSKYCPMSPGWQNPHSPPLRATPLEHHAHKHWGGVCPRVCISGKGKAPPPSPWSFPQDPGSKHKERKRMSCSRLFSHFPSSSELNLLSRKRHKQSLKWTFLLF